MAGSVGARVALPAPKPVRSGDVSRPGRAIRRTGPAAADARFAALLSQVERNSRRQRAHPSARQRADEAQAAATPPRNERQAGAMANQVEAMNAARAAPPKTDGFLQVLRVELEKVMPKTLDDSQRFLGDGQKSELKGAVSGGVRDAKSEATAPVANATAAKPDPAGVPERSAENTAPESPPGGVPLAAANAVPVPKPDTEVTQQGKADSADAQMRDAEVTTPQLEKANEPSFREVTTARRELGAKVAAAPGQYRTAERRVLVAGVAEAQVVGRAGLAGMVAHRLQGESGVKSRQQLARELDQRRRQAVTDHIESLYVGTRTRVESMLASLETDVMFVFESGIEGALRTMKSYADREIAAFKSERYGGVRGKLRWVADLFRACPQGIKDILAVARGRFTEAMDTLAVRVADMVDRLLAAAKAEVQKGRAEIADYVANLPKDLQKVGKTAQSEVQGRFDELESSIDSKKQELASGLAQKWKAANDKASAELAAIEAANAGALKKFAEKLVAIVKIIAEFKNKLMNALRKGWATIKLILADPIGFLGNLLSAIKGGVSAFVDNFQKWLMEGLAKWLFGNLANAGVTMPTDLSPASIFKLVMQLLGITYANIRGIAVRVVGEPVVKTLETMAEYVRIFVTGGPLALWEHIKEQLTDLKEMVVDALIDWVRSTIIKKATVKLLSMFNPVGAFIQACIMIYDLVMFLIEQAKQILAFIEAVLSSVHSIATGAIGSAVALIEKALGAMVPLVIAFLARLVGLGGIAEKVIGIIKKIQAKVHKGIEWVVRKVVTVLKKVAGKALASVASGARKVVAWWRASHAFEAGGESHRLSFAGEAAAAKLMIASEPTTLQAFLQKQEAGSLTKAQKQAITRIRSEVAATEKFLGSTGTAETDDAKQRVEKHMQKVAVELKVLLGTGLLGSETNPLGIEYTKRRASAYPLIYIGPLSEKRVEQAWLRGNNLKAILAVLSKSEAKEWAGRKNEILVYYPTQPRKLPKGEKEIGLSEKFRVDVGTVVNYHGGSTKGGGLINSELHPYGYRARDEGLDGDHVVEMQIGGPNELWNLWPLDKGENRSSGALLSHRITAALAKLTKQGAGAVKESGLHLLIEKVDVGDKKA